MTSEVVAKKSSVRARLIAWFLWRTHAKRKFQQIEGLREDVLKSRPKNPKPPRSLYRRFHVKETTQMGQRIFRLTRASSSGSKQVLYLHGGAYVYEIMAVQWKLIGKLLDSTDVSVTVPLYPLAPEHTAEQVLNFVSEVYEDLRRDEQSGPVVILGDSAGGGMALALSQQLRDRNRSQPESLVLISPWLDVTCADPAQDALEQLDPMLARPGLREQGRWYAGPLSTRDPSVSPLFGDLQDLPPMLVLAGTHDLLYADATRLADRVETQPGKLKVLTFPEMLHVWPAMPIPEAKQAIAAIVKFLQRNG